jgi:hypothetical protein
MKMQQRQSDHFRISFICTTLDARRGCCVKNPVLRSADENKKNERIHTASHRAQKNQTVLSASCLFIVRRRRRPKREMSAFEDRSSASLASVTTFCQLNCSIVYTWQHNLGFYKGDTCRRCSFFIPSIVM